MDLKDAYHLAIKLMDEHRLIRLDNETQGWKFRFDGGKRRFGRCNYARKEISLSRYLTSLNSEEHVKNTILHEIAHALCPNEHHGEKWVRVAKSIGCTGERCYSAEVSRPKGNYTFTCPNCAKAINRFRVKKTDIACSDCCNKYNDGKFDFKYKFIITRN